MNSETALNPSADCGSEPWQLSLFPFDPWGAKYAFEVVEHPACGISRAMIGPLALGESYKLSAIQCLASTEDGTFAASMWIERPEIEDPNIFWEEVKTKLTTARQRPIADDSVKWHLSSDDCIRTWTRPEFWESDGESVPRCAHALSKLLKYQEYGDELFVCDGELVGIEARAMAMLREQVDRAVSWVVNGLFPGLGSVLTKRPSLSIALAHQIVSQAKSYGSNAIAYALQALSTESVGVLHLIASGQPEDDAQKVMNAIFKGYSVPDAFVDIGIPRATYRRTLSKASRDRSATMKPATGLSDLPLAGRDWLFAMRLTTLRPFNSPGDISEFSQLLSCIQAISFQQSETAPHLLQWCISPGYTKCCARLSLLMNQAYTLIGACGGLIGKHLTIDEAVSATLNWVQDLPEGVRAGSDFSEALDPDNPALILSCVAMASGQPLNQLMRPIFEIHPGVPSHFQVPSYLTLQPLNSFDVAVLHGRTCGNCLQYASTVASYVVEGAALYRVSTETGIAGTIALRYDKSERNPKVEVQEVTGLKNAPAMIELCGFAQSLAESWSSEEVMAKWACYEDRCSQWRNMACSSLSDR